jgi:HK97 family phage major capsid protein
MKTKALRGLKITDEAEGRVQAVFATLNVKDKDGDVTRDGAFEPGAEVRISAWNHASWGAGMLPVGKGVIGQHGDEAILDSQFFLSTDAGRETFTTIKELGSLVEWSYGYDILDAEPGQKDGENVQFLNRVKVHEVSPVLLGAGENTRTLLAKSFGVEIESADTPAKTDTPKEGEKLADHLDRVIGEVEALADRLADAVAKRAEADNGRKNQKLSEATYERGERLLEQVKRLREALAIEPQINPEAVRLGQVANYLPLGKMFYDGFIKTGRRKEQQIAIDDFDTAVYLKTTMATTAGWAPPTIRTGRFVEDEQRQIQVLDVVPSNTTTAAAVVYMEETTFTNAAAETAEAGTYAESALALTEQTSPVRKIATFIPVTDEQLEDVPQVQGYLNNRLPFMLRQRLDAQIVAGNGTAPNLRGIINVVGVQTQARGTDPVPDAIYKAMVKVRVTGRADPSAIIVHPTDWQNVRLLRTADGLYIWGNPSEVGVERMWGLPVVQAEVIGAAGTALVGDFATYYELVFRRGIELKVTDSHQDFFIKGTQVIRADVRAASVVYRPTAFCQVTGL